MGGDRGFAAGRDAAETENEGVGDGGWRGGGGEGWGSGHVVMMFRKEGFKCGLDNSVARARPKSLWRLSTRELYSSRRDFDRSIGSTKYLNTCQAQEKNCGNSIEPIRS